MSSFPPCPGPTRQFQTQATWLKRTLLDITRVILSGLLVVGIVHLYDFQVDKARRRSHRTPESGLNCAFLRVLDPDSLHVWDSS